MITQTRKLLAPRTLSLHLACHRCDAAAEDMLQDVFIQILEKAPLCNPALGKTLTWAVPLARNKATYHLRSTRRSDRLQGDMQRESEFFEQFDRHRSFEAMASVETSRPLHLKS